MTIAKELKDKYNESAKPNSSISALMKKFAIAYLNKGWSKVLKQTEFCGNKSGSLVKILPIKTKKNLSSDVLHKTYDSHKIKPFFSIDNDLTVKTKSDYLEKKITFIKQQPIAVLFSNNNRKNSIRLLII